MTSQIELFKAQYPNIDFNSLIYLKSNDSNKMRYLNIITQSVYIYDVSANLWSQTKVEAR
jgi:hypothetical protein